MKQKISYLLLISMGLAACGGEPKQAEENHEVTPEICNLVYDASSTEVGFTAYKFTEKAGVKGSFDSIYMQLPDAAPELTACLQNARFEIPVSSINTANPDRDKKIIHFFFGALTDSLKIGGVVNSVEGDNTSGKVMFTLNLNNVNEPVALEYTMNGDTLTMQGEINLETFKAQEGITRLNKECEQLHTGEDGKSVLWPDVSIQISTVFKKECK